MRKHQLFGKWSKCKFGCWEIVYLGHLISGQGLRVDLEKLRVIKEWPQHNSVKALKGFLGLTGYYRCFIKGYGVNTVALTTLLKKNSFQ